MSFTAKINKRGVKRSAQGQQSRLTQEELATLHKTMLQRTFFGYTVVGQELTPPKGAYKGGKGLGAGENLLSFEEVLEKVEDLIVSEGPAMISAMTAAGGLPTRQELVKAATKSLCFNIHHKTFEKGENVEGLKHWLNRIADNIIVKRKVPEVKTVLDRCHIKEMEKEPVAGDGSSARASAASTASSPASTGSASAPIVPTMPSSTVATVVQAIPVGGSDNGKSAAPASPTGQGTGSTGDVAMDDRPLQRSDFVTTHQFEQACFARVVKQEEGGTLAEAPDQSNTVWRPWALPPGGSASDALNVDDSGSFAKAVKTTDKPDPLDPRMAAHFAGMCWARNPDAPDPRADSADKPGGADEPGDAVNAVGADKPKRKPKGVGAPKPVLEVVPENDTVSEDDEELPDGASTLVNGNGAPAPVNGNGAAGAGQSAPVPGGAIRKTKEQERSNPYSKEKVKTEKAKTDKAKTDTERLDLLETHFATVVDMVKKLYEQQIPAQE